MPSGAGSDSNEDLFEVALKMAGVAAGVMAAAGAVLVGPAELGGWLVNGHRWLPLEPAQVLAIAWYWIHDLGDPMGGWPAAERSLLPGRALYLGLLLLELVVLTGLIWAGFRGVLLLHREGVGSGPPSEGRLSRRHRV